MSRLHAFLNPVVRSKEKEVVISDRFVDENGELMTFKIRALTQEENEAITRKATHTRMVNGHMQDYIDHVDFTRRTVVLATLDPDFSSKEACDACGVMDPLDVPSKMLFSGEFNRLAKEITELSGLSLDAGEQAKK